LNAYELEKMGIRPTPENKALVDFLKPVPRNKKLGEFETPKANNLETTQVTSSG